MSQCSLALHWDASCPYWIRGSQQQLPLGQSKWRAGFLEQMRSVREGSYSDSHHEGFSCFVLHTGLESPTTPAKTPPTQRLDCSKSRGAQLSPMVYNRLTHVGGEQGHASLGRGWLRLPYLQDDIIDDVESFVAASEILKERGAYKIYVMATHGILSAEAPRLIEESPIDEVCLFEGLGH